MKIKRRNLWGMTLLVGLGLLFTNCQGPVTFLQPLQSQVVISLGGFAKHLSAARNVAPSSPGLVQTGAKPAALRLYPVVANNATAPRFIHPDTNMIRVTVTADDFAIMVFEGYIGYDYLLEVTFDVPAGDDRTFSIELYNGDTTPVLVGSATVTASIWLSPTPIYATIVPVATNFTSSGNPTTSIAADNSWHVIKLDYSGYSPGFTYYYVNTTADLSALLSTGLYYYDGFGVLDGSGSEVFLNPQINMTSNSITELMPSNYGDSSIDNVLYLVYHSSNGACDFTIGTYNP